VAICKVPPGHEKTPNSLPLPTFSQSEWLLLKIRTRGELARRATANLIRERTTAVPISVRMKDIPAKCSLRGLYYPYQPALKEFRCVSCRSVIQNDLQATSSRGRWGIDLISLHEGMDTSTPEWRSGIQHSCRHRQVRAAANTRLGQKPGSAARAMGSAIGVRYGSNTRTAF
jgi:hypothetical protein